MTSHPEDPAPDPGGRRGPGSDTLLAERYGGRGPRHRRLLLAIALVLAVLGGGWLVWAVWLESNPQVQSGLVSTRVRNDHAVTAQVQVAFGGPHIVADCLLQALAADHSVVGELNFRAGPSRAGRITVNRTFRTERRATVVNLVGCTTPDQRRPR
ncbi:MAG TPA: DUF4307 domain-containing protein [Marmoricola sp.]